MKKRVRKYTPLEELKRKIESDMSLWDKVKWKYWDIELRILEYLKNKWD